MFVLSLHRWWALLSLLGVGCASCPASAPREPGSLPYNPALDELDQQRLNEVRLAKAHNCYRKCSGEVGWRKVSDALAYTNVVELDIRPSVSRKDFSVGHVGIQYNNCQRLHTRGSYWGGWLSDCLDGLRTWSDENPGHPLIVVNVDLKVGLNGKYKPFDQLIEAIGREKLLRPQDLRGSHPDLRSAVASKGWPKLGELRGRFMFVLTGGTYENFSERNKSLRGYVQRRYRGDSFEANAFACPDVRDGNDLETNGSWADLDSVKRNIVCGNVQHRFVHRMHTDSASFRQTLVLAWDYPRNDAAAAHAASHWLSIVGIDLSEQLPDPGHFIGVRGGAASPATVAPE